MEINFKIKTIKRHPCQSCGACCAFFRVSFHWSETLFESFLVPENLTLSIGPHLSAMNGTNQPQPRCVAFKGEVGQSVSCEIYPNRPSTCRSFKPSYEDGTKNIQCEQARANKGLLLLSLADW